MRNMEYVFSATTDIGISRESNQDSVCIMSASWKNTPVIMAIICDGMGGLSNGELASATVICSFESWFRDELPTLLGRNNMNQLSHIWCNRLLRISEKIKQYSSKTSSSMGTTFSGMLIIGTQYMIIHVGDTRVYRLHQKTEQLTTDHTYVAREIAAGRMTVDEAKYSPKRSTLLQCIGASKRFKPDIYFGEVKKGDSYLICSDGFRHRLTEEEMYIRFSGEILKNSTSIEKQCKEVIKEMIKRGEKDNISALLIHAK